MNSPAVRQLSFFNQLPDECAVWCQLCLRWVDHSPAVAGAVALDRHQRQVHADGH
jgi:hypothetical protein